MRFFKILSLLFIFEIALAQTQKPKISLSFPETFKADEEIEVLISTSNLKNVPYDLKISIEKEKEVLSEIYNEKEGKWQDSFYYIKNLFSGPSFEGRFKMKLKKEFLFFDGDAEILARIRENGKSSYIEYRGKIKILKPEIKKEENKKEFLAEIPKNQGEEKISPRLIAILNSLFCGFLILILKLKLKSLENKNQGAQNKT
jgi:hypothetical protein